jgi:hypothetical protein
MHKHDGVSADAATTLLTLCYFAYNALFWFGNEIFQHMLEMQ